MSVSNQVHFPKQVLKKECCEIVLGDRIAIWNKRLVWIHRTPHPPKPQADPSIKYKNLNFRYTSRTEKGTFVSSASELLISKAAETATVTKVC